MADFGLVLSTRLKFKLFGPQGLNLAHTNCSEKFNNRYAIYMNIIDPTFVPLLITRMNLIRFHRPGWTYRNYNLLRKLYVLHLSPTITFFPTLVVRMNVENVGPL